VYLKLPEVSPDDAAPAELVPKEAFAVVINCQVMGFSMFGGQCDQTLRFVHGGNRLPQSYEVVLRPGEEHRLVLKTQAGKRRYRIENLCSAPRVSWEPTGFEAWYRRRRGIRLEIPAVITDNCVRI